MRLPIRTVEYNFFHNNHYTKYIDQEEVRFLNMYNQAYWLTNMNADALRLNLKYVYCLTNVLKSAPQN